MVDWKELTKQGINKSAELAKDSMAKSKEKAEMKKNERNNPEPVKEVKIDKKTSMYLSKRGLDTVGPEHQQQVKNIMGDLTGNGLVKAGMALSFSKPEEQAKITYLSALVEQNWILVRQNETIIEELKKLNRR